MVSEPEESCVEVARRTRELGEPLRPDEADHLSLTHRLARLERSRKISKRYLPELLEPFRLYVDTRQAR